MRSKEYWDAAMTVECNNACGFNVVSTGYIWTITAGHDIIEVRNGLRSGHPLSRKREMSFLGILLLQIFRARLAFTVSVLPTMV